MARDTIPVTVWFQRDVERQIRIMAAKFNINRSEFIREAVERYLRFLSIEEATNAAQLEQFMRYEG